MLSYYLTLGVGPDASDAQIRAAYLELVKKNPPEKKPERFQQIDKAYEAIRNRRARISARLFSIRDAGDWEGLLSEFASSPALARKRATLGEVLEANDRIARRKP